MKLLRDMIAHEFEEEAPESPNPYRHIVVALDGSPAAERVLPYVAAMAQRFGSRLTLIRAVTPIEAALMGDALARSAMRGHPNPSATPPETSEYDAIGYLASIQHRLERAGLSVQTECPEGHHGEAIIERAREVNADLIAMTTHGRGGIKRAILGSVADEVVRAAHCPVLLVRLDS